PVLPRHLPTRGRGGRGARLRALDAGLRGAGADPHRRPSGPRRRPRVSSTGPHRRRAGLGVASARVAPGCAPPRRPCAAQPGRRWHPERARRRLHGRGDARARAGAHPRRRRLAGLSALPVVVKGVQRADDAVRCIEAGAAAVVVSNHGARQLADAPPTADILGEIADAVGGRAEVYVDGGVRRSADVVKALALGARAVLVRRPSLWTLATGGADGVTALLRWYQAELRRAMALCGAGTVDAIERGLVRRAQA